MAGFNYQLVEKAAEELYIRALKFLPPDVTAALEKAYSRETNDTAKSILKTILRNIEIAKNEQLLICQDTGLPIPRGWSQNIHCPREGGQGGYIKPSLSRQFHPPDLKDKSADQRRQGSAGHSLGV